MPAQLSIDADAVRTVADALGKIDTQLRNDGEQVTGLFSRLDASVQYADVDAATQLRQVQSALNDVSSLLQEAQKRLIQVVDDTLHLEQAIAAGGPGGSGGSGGAPPAGSGSNGEGGWQKQTNQFSYGFPDADGGYGTTKTPRENETALGVEVVGVSYTGLEYTLGGSPDSPGTYGGIAVKVGDAQAGVGVDFNGADPEKWQAGAFASVTTASVTADGRWGSDTLGVSGSATVAGPSADAFAGIKDGQVGVDIGGSLVSAQGSAGVDVAGQNVGVDGSVGLQWHLGFSLGEETELKLPFVSFGFHF